LASGEIPPHALPFDDTTGLDAIGLPRYILHGKNDNDGRGKNASISGVTIPKGACNIILFSKCSAVDFVSSVTLICEMPVTILD